MYVCIMRQCFCVGTSYGSWLGLTIPAYGWDVTAGIRAIRVQYDTEGHIFENLR
jgi:hypothetical protein